MISKRWNIQGIWDQFHPTAFYPMPILTVKRDSIANPWAFTFRKFIYHRISLIWPGLILTQKLFWTVCVYQYFLGFKKCKANAQICFYVSSIYCLQAYKKILVYRIEDFKRRNTGKTFLQLIAKVVQTRHIL